ncbi:pyruvate formate lyase family protein, partial [Ruminococcaceae bacterium OttesenSCG-928-I18]|nr:pyruvate formate lyase family protein [Ruminococcaceae bacterium OttesenSCG-928-I18]
DDKARRLFEEERREKTVLNGWFLSRELAADASEGQRVGEEEKAVVELEAVIDALPLEISEHAIFAGTQRDAFAASYSLINPAFTVEGFGGYCDPLEVYDFATPTQEISKERIAAMRKRAAKSDYNKDLSKVYADYAQYTEEVAFFVEQVTGHTVPDFRGALRHGVRHMVGQIDEKLQESTLPEKKRQTLGAMRRSLLACVRLAHRYADIAAEQKAAAGSPERAQQLQLIEETLRRVPEYGAESLYEAMQSYLLLWQVMCLEQAPNPFAFSVGNADRIFLPYMQAEGLSRRQAAALFKHFLVFFNVGERSWAISQNVIVSGRDVQGRDLTNEMTYAIFDAYYEMNLPQPILSVKLHKNTPEKLYREMGRFFFTPGCLTPSIFNDDSLFETLRESGIEEEDLPEYAIAGCQEPVIMGKDNANTTNSWLNLGKILELTLTGGKSSLTGKPIGPQAEEEDPLSLLQNLRERFYDRLAFFCREMADAANGASLALSHLRVPFLSCFMGGMQTAVDYRDPEEQGTKYNGSCCLIHGLSVVADSFVAVDHLLTERPEDAGELIEAVRCNFEGHEELRAYLHGCPKFGNNLAEVDEEAAEVALHVSLLVKSLRNYLGNPFRPDWSTPSTHLLYGYWVGATPDGRAAREMLGYGVDPLYGEASNGLGFRTLSTMKLPFEQFCGGVASHFGVDPKYFTASSHEERGLQFYHRTIRPLFFNPLNEKRAPFYLYVNVTTAELLQKLLENPKKYAPNGVYIMRIHGTFVNFLDLSPAIQQDIIKRLDPASTRC